MPKSLKVFILIVIVAGLCFISYHAGILSVRFGNMKGEYITARVIHNVGEYVKENKKLPRKWDHINTDIETTEKTTVNWNIIIGVSSDADILDSIDIKSHS